MRVLPLAVAGALVAAAGAATPATAASRPKSIKKSYTATAVAPDPTNQAASDYSVCAMNVPGSFHVENVKVLGAGKIKVTATDFVGDWDILILDAKGTQLGTGEVTNTGAPTKPDPEVAGAKFKKAGTYKVIVCNWAGGPTASVSYVFTYA